MQIVEAAPVLPEEFKSVVWRYEELARPVRDDGAALFVSSALGEGGFTSTKLRSPCYGRSWGSGISIKETTISGDAANEIHSAWALNLVGVSGKTCTLNWRSFRKWNESRVVYEHHYDQQRSGAPLTFDDLGLDIIGLSLGFKGDRDR